MPVYLVYPIGQICVVEVAARTSRKGIELNEDCVGGWRRDVFFFLTGAHWTSIPLLQLAEGDRRGAAPFGFKSAGLV